MTATWIPVILCAPGDEKSLAEIAPVASVVAVTDHDGHLVFRPTTATGIAASNDIPPASIYRDAVGFFAASPKAAVVYDKLSAFWLAQFGMAKPPAFSDLSKAPGGSALAAYAQICAGQFQSLHQRNSRLMRELGVVRAAHDDMQSSFARLEAFFYQNNRSERISSMTLPVHRKQRPVELRAGIELEQRLPLDSSGICDVAISVRSLPRSKVGVLRASLELKESGKTVAVWMIPAAKITLDWLRLSLDRALNADSQTPILRLNWDGDSPLLLNTSFFHPDPRFMPFPQSPLLALEIWKYVPGAQATMSPNGILPQGVGGPNTWNIGRSLLREAVAVSADKDNVLYSEPLTGLLVKPSSETMTVARLDRAAQTGVHHLYGGIKTEDVTGPVSEYAYGLCPSRLRPIIGQALPVFDKGMASEWYPLTPNEWSELHLILTEPLEEPHDLFLMTRLAKGETAEVPPECCFFRITARGGDAAAMLERTE